MHTTLTADDVNQMLINLTALVSSITGLCIALKTRGVQKERIQKTDNLSVKVEENTNRIASLENGGGDKKIDERLAQYGVIDRRTPVPKDEEVANVRQAIR